MSVFVLVFASLLAIAHGYVWHRVVRAGRLHRPFSWIATTLITLGWLVILSAFVLWRSIPFRDATPYLIASFVWLGTFFYLVAFLMLIDGVRAAHWISTRLFPKRADDRDTADAAREGTAASIETTSASSPARSGGAFQPGDDAARPTGPRVGRREFLSRAAASTSAIGALGTSAWGLRSANVDITTPEVPVRLSRLPRTLDGFRIAVIADVHIGPILDGGFMRSVVEQTNRLAPDLVVIVGDLVDGSVAMLRDDIAPLAGLRARYGTCFVTGNHEFYVGARPWMQHLPRLGIRVLSNELVPIGDSGSGASFDLAGFNDSAAWRIDPALGPDARTLAPRVDPERELIVLAHQPRNIDSAVALNAGLQISGHTHGGQLWPFGLVVLLAQPYVSGLHRHTPSTQIYVSRGTGYWGPPMRVLAPAEISQIILVAS